MGLEIKEERDAPKKKILLHTCCAVCFGYPSQLLKMFKYDVTAYFYNPNIHPETEFLRRREELERICKKYNFELIIENYTPQDFNEIIQTDETLKKTPEQGERCKKCFELRLNKTAQKAKELGFESFTTTLSVSSHKNSAQILEAGTLAQELTGIEFETFNFKENNGTKITQEIARFNELYRQNYCGCEFSMERITKKTP